MQGLHTTLTTLLEPAQEALLPLWLPHQMIKSNLCLKHMNSRSFILMRIHTYSLTNRPKPLECMFHKARLFWSADNNLTVYILWIELLDWSFQHTWVAWNMGWMGRTEGRKGGGNPVMGRERNITPQIRRFCPARQNQEDSWENTASRDYNQRHHPLLWYQVSPTSRLQCDESEDVLLADVCIGTSAAPYYLPSYHFTHTPSRGLPREFNLIDGGVVANNPVYIHS